MEGETWWVCCEDWDRSGSLPSIHLAQSRPWAPWRGRCSRPPLRRELCSSVAHTAASRVVWSGQPARSPGPSRKGLSSDPGMLGSGCQWASAVPRAQGGLSRPPPPWDPTPRALLPSRP